MASRIGNKRRGIILPADLRSIADLQRKTVFGRAPGNRSDRRGLVGCSGFKRNPFPTIEQWSERMRRLLVGVLLTGGMAAAAAVATPAFAPDYTDLHSA